MNYHEKQVLNRWQEAQIQLNPAVKKNKAGIFRLKHLKYISFLCSGRGPLATLIPRNKTRQVPLVGSEGKHTFHSYKEIIFYTQILYFQLLNLLVMSWPNTIPWPRCCSTAWGRAIQRRLEQQRGIPLPLTALRRGCLQIHHWRHDHWDPCLKVLTKILRRSISKVLCRSE